jgi:hypothetical protein
VPQQVARRLDLTVAVNIIADPDWDEQRFATIREWCMEVPEIVNISVNTPYPGTESWLTDGRRLATRDYRLFDIQHAVLPTKLPLDRFYAELVRTQQVLFRKHMDWRNARGAAKAAAGHLLRGQTNFPKSLFKFNSVFNADALLADHALPVRYEMAPPPPVAAIGKIKPAKLYVHAPRGRAGRATDDHMESFVEETRMGATE